MATATQSVPSAHQFVKETDNDKPPTTNISKFSGARFLRDVEALCQAFDAPYSASTTQAVLEAYAIHFNSAPVGWRATSKDNSLNYRFYQSSPPGPDTIDIALRAGFIAPSALVDMVRPWTALFGGEVQQACDFDTAQGLEKTWLWLVHTRDMEDVLDLPSVPARIRKHVEIFKKHRMDRARTLAVDWKKETINIYWRVPGPLTHAQANALLALAGAEPLGEKETQEIARFGATRDGSFAFALTLDWKSGEIGRAGFYATKLKRENLPTFRSEVEGERRLQRFLESAPDYDSEEWITVGWGYARGGRRYMKVEKSYCGEFMSTVKEMLVKDPNV